MKTGEVISKRILDLCEERKITVNKLCNISGVTQSTINNILNGRNNSTTVATVKKLCDGLGITLGQFFSVKEFDEAEQEVR